MKINLPDYHIHTTLCNHACGVMEDYVEKAVEKGFKEIGFAEHMPVMTEPHLCMSYDDLPYYVERVKNIQERYKGAISVKLGAEMDMNLERTDEIFKIIETYEFDYVIGSIHYLGIWPFDQKQYKDVFEKNDINEIYGRFFNTVLKAAKTGIYDITGHIDNLKRMGYRPDMDLTPYYEKAAAILKEMNLTIEINSSGYDYPAMEAYPSPAFLKILFKHGVPVTFGSDSHSPEHLGRHFDKALKTAVDAGYSSVAFFDKRKRIMKPF